MKASLVLAALFFFAVPAKAQTNFFKRPGSPRVENNWLITKGKQPAIRLNFAANEVKILPLDNMPCRVPDLSLITAIPTSKALQFNQYIPNPLAK